jgi:hypothetical protein
VRADACTVFLVYGVAWSYSRFDAARDLQSRASILEFLINFGSNLLFFTQIKTEKDPLVFFVRKLGPTNYFAAYAPLRD